MELDSCSHKFHSVLYHLNMGKCCKVVGHLRSIGQGTGLALVLESLSISGLWPSRFCAKNNIARKHFIIHWIMGSS